MTRLPSLPSIPDLRLHPAENGRLQIYFPYHPDNVARIKSIPGRRWHKEEKCWSIPHTEEAIARLRQLFGDHPPSSFPRRPTAVAKRRWKQLSAEEQAFITPVEEELKLRGYSPRTRKSYRNHLLRFKRHFERDPECLSTTDIREYLLFLIDEKQVSRSYHNQAISAVKFLYNNVLNNPKVLEKIPRPRREERLPCVLSRGEVLCILGAITDVKHRALLMVAYSAGLRVSEVARLKVEDIDSERGVIRVRRAKGRKDRYTTLSEILLETLRAYWKSSKPDQWLFPGVRPGKHISVRTVQKVLERAREKANLRKHVTMHTLRHYAE